MNTPQEEAPRRRRTREEVRQLVSAFQTSGLRAREFCQRHGLAPSTLRRLKRPEPTWFLEDPGDRGLNGVHKTHGGAACLRIALYRIEKLGSSALIEASPHPVAKRRASANTSSAWGRIPQDGG
jgi:hypothetical protein